ncbi:MAG: hypothetical protein CMK74_14680 [Pseudomonadales bacterium]|jgi:hypothetical protein|nr:hypothetical protein [Pseudomonadales bacterium]
MTTKRTPPDLEQCQVEKPNGANFMTLGGVVGGMVRCTEKPTCIVHELKPQAGETQCGSMSMCTPCLLVFMQQVQPDASEYRFEELKVVEAEKDR